MDWAHIPNVGDVLIVVDAGSGWLEAKLLPDRATKEVIGMLRELFCRLGVPDTLVSDNAKEFVSKHLKSWLENIGCRQVLAPIYHPPIKWVG